MTTKSFRCLYAFTTYDDHLDDKLSSLLEFPWTKVSMSSVGPHAINGSAVDTITKVLLCVITDKLVPVEKRILLLLWLYCERLVCT